MVFNNKQNEHSTQDTLKDENHIENNVEQNKQDITESPSSESSPKVQDRAEQEIASLQAKVKELNDTILRQHADNENLRKRYQRELEDMSKYAVTEFARDLIEIFENIYRAKSHIDLSTEQDNRVKNMFEGLEMTTKLLENIWQKHGMARLYPKDEEFNHDLHQAISHITSPDRQNNMIVDVIQSGYTLKDRLLRPALVVIVKND